MDIPSAPGRRNSTDSGYSSPVSKSPPESASQVFDRKVEADVLWERIEQRGKTLQAENLLLQQKSDADV